MAGDTLDDMAAWAAWQRLCGELGVRGPAADKLGKRLAAQYTRWPRHYHASGHLMACLQQARACRRQLAAPAAVDFALWFHDAIYWPWRRDNEARSAKWAKKSALALGLDEAFADQVHAMVMATAHLGGAPAGAPAGTEPPTPRPLTDTDWLVDIDLSILGEDRATYDQYEAGVRREYFFIPKKDWRLGRGAVLKHFLDQPAIFRTPTYRDRYEAIARANLQRALAALNAGQDSAGQDSAA